MKKYIWVTTKFPAVHFFSAAKPPFDFLKWPHRHLFHVKVTIAVMHNDRDIEFLQFKEDLEKFLSRTYQSSFKKPITASCEDIACAIVGWVNQAFEELRGREIQVEVSEDGENGALVCDII